MSYTEEEKWFLTTISIFSAMISALRIYLKRSSKVLFIKRRVKRLLKFHIRNFQESNQHTNTPASFFFFFIKIVPITSLPVY